MVAKMKISMPIRYSRGACTEYIRGSQMKFGISLEKQQKFVLKMTNNRCIDDVIVAGTNSLTHIDMRMFSI